jgi:glycolate dehydrogenase FAD-linked subunit
LIGSARVLRDEERLEKYAQDESGLGRFLPEAAVLCETAGEVREVLSWARADRVAVTPRGAGTGMTGGALAVRGGIVLSTERMTRILEIDGEDLVAVVEPGVVTAVLQDEVEQRGLFYPPDPASLQSCSLGGNVAENAGGPRAFKYGVTREYVLGLDVALMGGQTIRCGRRTVKGVTGYDVTALLVGSEGTLGVCTSVTLRLLPRPAAVATLLALFQSAVKAGEAVSAVLRRGERPRCLELMDRVSIDHVRKQNPFKIPEGTGAAVIIELDGDPAGLEAALLGCAQACEEAGAHEVLVAEDEKRRRDLWATRRNVSPALKEAHRRKIAEDIVVPRGKIAAMIARVEDIGARHRVLTCVFGHAGDGNLHVNLLDDGKTGPERMEAALRDVFRATLDLGGTLSGEHGIGIAKHRYLSWEQSAELIDLQLRLKRALDPDDLLNPGKIFPPA